MAVRRWVSDVEGKLGLVGYFHNTSANGDGTNGRIFLNDSEVIALYTDGTRQDFNLFLDIKTGDKLDFIVDWGNADDSANDNTTFEVSIYNDPISTTAPFPSVSLPMEVSFTGRIP